MTALLRRHPNRMSNSFEDIEARHDELFKQFVSIAEAGRKADRQVIETEFVFQTTTGPLTLAEAFEGKADLVLIHNMGTGCSFCTMWADGFNGVQQHLRDRAGLLLLSPNEPATVEEFAKGRGWKFPVASGRDSGFNEAMGFGTSNEPYPGFTTFHKAADGTITRICTESFGEFDLYAPIWHMLGRLKDGVNGWEPKFRYD